MLDCCWLCSRKSHKEEGGGGGGRREGRREGEREREREREGGREGGREGRGERKRATHGEIKKKRDVVVDITRWRKRGQQAQR